MCGTEINMGKRDLSKITGKVCALTFDDGPSEITPLILEILAKNNATASFFVVGENVPRHAEFCRRAISQGCTVENHTFTHKNITSMDFSDILANFYATQYVVKEATGEEPIYFRAPGGAVNKLGYEAIPLPFMIGDCGRGDWNSREDDPDTTNLEDRIKYFLEVAHDGHIYLMHDCAGNHLTPKALELVLPKLISEGYTFVNLRELFEIKGITPKAHEGHTWLNVTNGGAEEHPIWNHIVEMNI